VISVEKVNTVHVKLYKDVNETEAEVYFIVCSTEMNCRTIGAHQGYPHHKRCTKNKVWDVLIMALKSHCGRLLAILLKRLKN
jgi:hypothetical protein